MTTSSVKKGRITVLSGYNYATALSASVEYHYERSGPSSVTKFEVDTLKNKTISV